MHKTEVIGKYAKNSIKKKQMDFKSRSDLCTSTTKDTNGAKQRRDVGPAHSEVGACRRQSAYPRLLSQL